jgi:hypothetical protein
LQNYFTFIQELQQSGVSYLTVECAFGDSDFQLPADERILRVRAKDVMWMKERLINIGLMHVPPEYTVVAWLDCDILFQDDGWPVRALTALEQYTVIQLFTTVHRSEKDGPRQYKSFGAVRMIDSNRSQHGDLVTHGHTGFAWAAHRTLLDKHGLYDLCLTGSGDHVMAHAFCGETACACVDTRIQLRTNHWNHFRIWAESVGADVAGRVGAIDGDITHLWHGSIRGRNYSGRNREFRQFDFDPSRDVTLDPLGIWRWSSDKPDLHEWANLYFARRVEDG